MEVETSCSIFSNMQTPEHKKHLQAASMSILGLVTILPSCDI